MIAAITDKVKHELSAHQQAYLGRMALNGANE